MSANCLNVRIDNVILGNVTGDAVHKAYAVGDSDVRFDKSKNHFYTDLSIYKCNSPVNMGFISENVMCDNVFGTGLRYLVHLSAASNCIVSNSSLTVDRDTFYRPNYKNQSQIDTINPNLGLYVESACSCWFQNSYLSTNGRQRSTSRPTGESYYRNMSIKPDDSTDESFVDKRHMRNFIGEKFDIPNHWFKFTGCDVESSYGEDDYYFYEVTNKNLYSPISAQFGEYLDNCSYTINTSSEMFRFLAVNDLFGGITYRNCYMKNKTDSKDQPPFRMWCNYPSLKNETPCEDNTCPVNQTYGCAIYASGKKYPWVRFENNIFDNFMYGISYTSWYLLFKGGRPFDATHNKPSDDKVPYYLNACFSDGYKFKTNEYVHIPNSMKK